MGVETVLCVLIGCFLCICGGCIRFHRCYLCNRCFTNREKSARSRVHSEYSENNNKGDKPKPNFPERNSSLAAPDTKRGSSLSSGGSGMRKMDGKDGLNNLDSALSIKSNPVISFKSHDEQAKGSSESKRSKTAPV